MFAFSSRRTPSTSTLTLSAWRGRARKARAAARGQGAGNWKVCVHHPRSRGRSGPQRHLDLLDPLGARRGRSPPVAVAARVDAGELGAQQEDQRGEVDPEQEQHQRAGGAVGGVDAGPLEIEADGVLADREQHRGDRRAPGHVAPADLDVRQEPVHHPQQQRHQQPGEHDVRAADQLRDADLQPRLEHLLHGREAGAGGERDEHQGARRRGSAGSRRAAS